MKNRFETRCCYCREAVAPGAGRVWKWNGRWYGCHAGPAKTCTKADRVAAPARKFPARVMAGVDPVEKATGEELAEQFAAGTAAGLDRDQMLAELTA